MVQNMTYHAHSLKPLENLPLEFVASKLRSDVDMVTSCLIQESRLLATKLNWAKAKIALTSLLIFNFRKALSLVLELRSTVINWTLIWGLVYQRVLEDHFLVPRESLIYLWPKKLNGEIVAVPI